MNGSTGAKARVQPPEKPTCRSYTSSLSSFCGGYALTVFTSTGPVYDVKHPWNTIFCGQGLHGTPKVYKVVNVIEAIYTRRRQVLSFQSVYHWRLCMCS